MLERSARENYIGVVTSEDQFSIEERIKYNEDLLQKSPDDFDFHLYVGHLYCQKAESVKDNAGRKPELEKALSRLEIAKKHFTALNDPLGKLAATYADNVRYALAEIEDGGTKKGNIILGIGERSAAALQWLHLLYGEAGIWKDAATVAASYLQAHQFHEYPAMALAEGFLPFVGGSGLEKYTHAISSLRMIVNKDKRALDLILGRLVEGDYKSAGDYESAMHSLKLAKIIFLVDVLHGEDDQQFCQDFQKKIIESEVAVTKKYFPGTIKEKYALVMEIDKNDPEANLYFASRALSMVDLALVGISGDTSETATKCLDEVVKHCQNVLEAVPDHPEANLYLARVHFSRRNWESALSGYNKVQEELSKSTLKSSLSPGELDALVWCEYKAGNLKSIPAEVFMGGGYATTLILKISTVKTEELRSHRKRMKHFGFDPLEELKAESSYLSQLILEEIKLLSGKVDSNNLLNQNAKRSCFGAAKKWLGEIKQ